MAAWPSTICTFDEAMTCFYVQGFELSPNTYCHMQVWRCALVWLSLVWWSTGVACDCEWVIYTSEQWKADSNTLHAKHQTMFIKTKSWEIMNCILMSWMFFKGHRPQLHFPNSVRQPFFLSQHSMVRLRPAARVSLTFGPGQRARCGKGTAKPKVLRSRGETTRSISRYLKDMDSLRKPTWLPGYQVHMVWNIYMKRN